MKKVAILLIALMVVSVGFLSGCNENTQEDENQQGGNTAPQDTDGDGYNNDVDAFPSDPNEWKDSDDDGVGDNSDACPFNKQKWVLNLLTYDLVNSGSYLDIIPYDSVGWVELKNTASEPGTFVVNFHARTAAHDYYEQEQAYITPGETKRIEARYAALVFNEGITWEYSITAPMETC